jgi:pimeloyl-ACP methyl ester carboxylesterase
MTGRLAAIAIAVSTLAIPRLASAAPSCTPSGFALKHGNYATNRGPCTLNADNYYNQYLGSDYPAESTTTRYPGIVADFAGTTSNGNLAKLTADRVGVCPNAAGVCGGEFFQGDDPPTFPDNEKKSWASLALFNTVKSNGKLLVFFGGSPSLPKNYADFALRAAHAGYRVIVLAEINYGATQCVTEWGPQEGWSTVKGAPDPSEDECISRLIEYTNEGAPLAEPYASVFEDEIGPSSAKDSAHNRLNLLLRWLSVNFPDQGWSSYFSTLCAGSYCAYRINWSKVALAGHSMGTQNVAHFSSNYSVERAIYLAGPHPRLDNSGSNAGSGTPTYITDAGATNVNRMYTLLQTHDGWYDQQLANNIYGMALVYLLSGYANPNYVDHPGATFSNTYRLLIGDATPPSNCNPHSWVGSGCNSTRYEAAWDWMLTNPNP